MPKISGNGKKDNNLIATRVNDLYQDKINALLSREDSPFSSRSDFLYTLIVDYFSKEDQKSVTKEALIDMIENDPQILIALKKRMMD